MAGTIQSWSLLTGTEARDPTGFAADDWRLDNSIDRPDSILSTIFCRLDHVSYCGVGCNVTLHVQDNETVKVTSPHDNPVAHGNLRIKGRFGFQHVQNRV